VTTKCALLSNSLELFAELGLAWLQGLTGPERSYGPAARQQPGDQYLEYTGKTLVHSFQNQETASRRNCGISEGKRQNGN
jgi:hypothetical protein